MDKESIFSKIEKEKREMSSFLHANNPSPSTREKLQEQLRWFAHQEEYYKDQDDLEIFVDKFNWLVKNFNDDLGLDPEEKFPRLFVESD